MLSKPEAVAATIISRRARFINRCIEHGRCVRVLQRVKASFSAVFSFREPAQASGASHSTAAPGPRSHGVRAPRG